MRKKRAPVPYIEVLRKLAAAGVSSSPKVKDQRVDASVEEIASLRQRVDLLMGIVEREQRPQTNMLFFVMYDIESNKVRRHIAKYLERKGCHRIQRSIFMADLDRSVYAEIKSDLAEVQALYDNEDSIIVCPISTDEIKAMKVIGQQLNMDIFLRQRNTLFF